MKSHLGPYEFRIQVRIQADLLEEIVYPLQTMRFVREKADSSGLEMSEGQFGLVPDWVDDSRGGPKYARKWKTYNARSEEIFSRPTNSEAIIRRRAAIPVDAYFEYADLAGNFKFRVFRKDLSPFWIAGLWEWNGRYNLQSCSMITTPPMDLVKEIHSRSPIVLSPDQALKWLDSKMTDQKEISKFLKAADSSELVWQQEESEKRRQKLLANPLVNVLSVPDRAKAPKSLHK